MPGQAILEVHSLRQTASILSTLEAHRLLQPMRMLQVHLLEQTTNADPTNNIMRVGDKYDLDLPIRAGFNPNNVSMQQLCAETQFGGGPPGQHIGG